MSATWRTSLACSSSRRRARTCSGGDMREMHGRYSGGIGEVCVLQLQTARPHLLGARRIRLSVRRGLGRAWLGAAGLGHCVYIGEV